MKMNEVYDKMFKHIFEPVLARFNIPDGERAYVIKFYLNGIFAIVTEWLDNGCREDIASIIKIISDYVIGARDLD